MRFKIFILNLAHLTAVFLLASARADLPVIQSIQVESTNLVVRAQVPPGHERIVLESRLGLTGGAWFPVAVQHGGGEGGMIVFRLPRTTESACFRVRVDETESLPASFYTGLSSFDPEPVWFGPTLFSPNPISSGGLTTFGNVAIQSQSATLTSDAAGGGAVEPREVVESDIWRLDGDTLYIFNQSRGLQIIDVKHPDRARLLATLSLPAVGEQMHVLPSHDIVLLTRPLCGDFPNSEVLIASTRHGEPRIVARLPVTGSIIEGRLVGTALYVASEAVGVASGGAVTSDWGTQISSFDLAVPHAPIARSTLWYPGRYHLVYATDTYFFVTSQYTSDGQPSRVNAIDITAPDGTMIERDSVTVAGYVADKFKLNWSDGVLSVISEVPSSPLVTKVETFRLADPRTTPPSPAVKLGELELGRGERLHATRFDGTRAYVVTFQQIDPLWVVDVSDPAHPTISGELQVPGWSTYIHPMGDHLVTVGRESNRTTVSLFDVSNPAHPAMLSRVPLGSGYSYSEAEYDEKAFAVLEEAGLILLPVRGPGTMYLTSFGSENGNGTDGLQLIDLDTNSLTVRGLIERNIAPRRAALHRNRIIAFSTTELFSVNATNRDAPWISGQLELSWPVNRVFAFGDHLIEIATDPPVLRVTPAGDPDQVLTSLTLTNVPIVGATMRGNRLYLLQSVRTSYGFALPTVIRSFPPVEGLTNLPPSTIVSFGDLTPFPTLWLSVVDLSHLPSLSVIGQTATATFSLGWNTEVEPVWLKSDVLVWFSRGGLPSVIPMSGQASTILSWYYIGGGARLSAFDVSDHTLSDINVASNGGQNFNKAFGADGLVYLSHNAYVELETTNILIGLLPPASFQKSYLDVVDYADARHPTVRPPVNIPGALQGISHHGDLLYTLSAHFYPTNWNERTMTLQACAYDGASAHLVDSLSFSNLSGFLSPPILVSGGNIFIANHVPSALETWRLSNEGKFTRLGGVSLRETATDLVAFPGLLAARLGANRVEVFADSDPTALRLVGEGPTIGCLGFNLRHAAAGTRHLWLPLDGYGATGIELSQGGTVGPRQTWNSFRCR